jgi:FixJ family two-component response regulator
VPLSPGFPAIAQRRSACVCRRAARNPSAPNVSILPVSIFPQWNLNERIERWWQVGPTPQNYSVAIYVLQLAISGRYTEMRTEQEQPELFIVDDDAMTRNHMSDVFTDAGYRVVKFLDVASFVAVARKRAPACVVLDINMPDRSGIEILKDLDALNYPAPILMSSRSGDIRSAVQAIKGGAVDYFEMQSGVDVVARVRDEVNIWRRRQHDGIELSRLRSSFPGCELLTPRERDVLTQIANGATSKEAATKLGISPRTVEIHRSQIMRKIGAKNTIDLARRVLGREQTPDRDPGTSQIAQGA